MAALQDMAKKLIINVDKTQIIEVRKTRERERKIGNKMQRRNNRKS